MDGRLCGKYRTWPLGFQVGANFVEVEAGQNLWRIARNVYAAEQSYTLIYKANRSEIRDPDLIYPGQVFSLPKPVNSG